MAQSMAQYYQDNKLERNTLDALVSMKNRLGNVISSDLYQGSKLVMYGSSLSGFATDDCDVDCCLWFPSHSAEAGCSRDQRRGHQILGNINQHLQGMGPSNPVLQEMTPSMQSAPVPVLKCRHRRHGTSIDISVGMTSGVTSTFLMRKYMEYDDKIGRLCLIVKQWRTKQDLLLTSTACVLMVINYLQAKGYVPVFSPNDPSSHANISWESFRSRTGDIDIEELEGMMKPGGNMVGRHSNLFSRSSTGRYMPPLEELLKGFFQHYCPFRFRQRRISIRSGTVEKRSRKGVYDEPVFIEEPVSGTNAAASTTGSSYLKLKCCLNDARNILNKSTDNWKFILLTTSERPSKQRKPRKRRQRKRVTTVSLFH